MPTPADTDPVELLTRHRERVRRLIGRLVAPHDADDVEQEVYVAALERPPRNAAALPSWIATTVRNLVAKSWRGRDRRRARELAAARAEPQPATADLVARVELEEFLLRCVRDLAEPEREVVLLRFFEGLGTGEIARRLGVGESTVRARLARAIVRLREQLDARSDGKRETWMAALAPAAAGGVGTGAAVMTGKVAAAAGIVLALAGGMLWWSRATPRDFKRVADSKGPQDATLEAPPTTTVATVADDAPQRAEESAPKAAAAAIPVVNALGQVAMHVVDAATSEPILNVYFRAIRDERSVDAHLGISGTTRLEYPLTVGTWEVAVSAEGYEPEFRRDVAISMGTTTDLGVIALGRGAGSLSIRLRGVARGAGVVRRIELRGEGRRPCPQCAPGRFSIASSSTEPDPVDPSPYKLADSPCCGYFTDRSLGKVVDDAPFEFGGLAAGIYFVRVRDVWPRLQRTLRLELARGEHRVLDVDCFEDVSLVLELEDDAGRPFVGLWETDGSETAAPIRFTVAVDGTGLAVDGVASVAAVRAARGPPRALTPAERGRVEAERAKLQLEENARLVADLMRGNPPLGDSFFEHERARLPTDTLFGAPPTPSYDCVACAIDRRDPAVFVVSRLPAARVTVSAHCRDLRAAPVELDLADPSQRRARLVLRAPQSDH